jgi:hypothetical protein
VTRAGEQRERDDEMEATAEATGAVGAARGKSATNRDKNGKKRAAPRRPWLSWRPTSSNLLAHAETKMLEGSPSLDASVFLFLLFMNFVTFIFFTPVCGCSWHW